MHHSKNVVKAHEVIGVNVVNNTKENLGKIEEIILNKSTGQVCYVALSYGGLLGMGNKLFAVPWNALTYNVEEDAFMLNVSQEKLKTAPGFDKNIWPDLADRTWGESIYGFYETKPYWQNK